MRKNIVKCCNYEFVGREFQLDPKNKVWRALFFLDECPACRTPIAEIKEKNHNGIIKTTFRRSGAAAVNLYEKHRNDYKKINYKVRKGTRTKEYYHYINNGSVYNLNNRVIATHQDFLTLRPPTGAN